jgi:hypothetical protein
LWRYHGLSPWGSIRISVGKKEVKNMTREPILLSFEKKSFWFTTEHHDRKSEYILIGDRGK